jgi:predicted amidohydrolase YtcJ
VFILHLYDRACSTRRAARVGYTTGTRPIPPGGEIERDKATATDRPALAKPNALILYATLAKGPKLPLDDQINSTRHFMRELNRLGVTSVIDAGGGFQNYPDDYDVIQRTARRGDDRAHRLQPVHPEGQRGEFSDFLAGST